MIAAPSKCSLTASAAYTFLWLEPAVEFLASDAIGAAGGNDTCVNFASRIEWNLFTALMSSVAHQEFVR